MKNTDVLINNINNEIVVDVKGKEKVFKFGKNFNLAKEIVYKMDLTNKLNLNSLTKKLEEVK